MAPASPRRRSPTWATTTSTSTAPPRSTSAPRPGCSRPSSARWGSRTPTIATGLAAAATVPGRFERVRGTDGRDDVAVIVDYAHTPDGLTEVLAAARAVTAGHVIVVFGAGGDRDHPKRPRMGAAAAAGA